MVQLVLPELKSRRDLTNLMKYMFELSRFVCIFFILFQYPFSVMVFIIIVLFLMPTAISGANDPLYTFCSTNARNYAPNSSSENNVKLLLEQLSSETSISGGFYNSGMGNDPDRVYGQALCRGDVNSAVCQNCVHEASQEIFKSCKTREAIIWYEQCQVHYSFTKFFS